MAVPRRVAVVGAGLAGLTCARQLQNSGVSSPVSVTVFEKSRSLAGRCATKTNFLDTPIDHGAPYFTLSNPDVEMLLRPLLPDLQELPPGSLVDPSGKALNTTFALHYCQSGNSSLGTALGAGLFVQHHTHVLDVRDDGTVTTQPRASGEAPGDITVHSPFDLVIVTAPLPQAATILSAPPSISRDWKSAFTPTLTALLAYDKTMIPQSSKVHLSASGHPPFAIVADDIWVGCESFKQRSKSSQCIFVAQASDEFSEEFVDRPEGEWLSLLRARTEKLWGLPEKAHVSSFAKRWRYSRVRGSRDPQLRSAKWMGWKVLLSGDGVGGISSVEEAVLEGLRTARIASEVLQGL